MAKLLTVEDEIAIRELLAFICETDGHEVVKAASLAEAREALRRGGLDLILLDVMLPDGSGFDFLREVRTDAASACTASASRRGKRNVAVPPSDAVTLRVSKSWNSKSRGAWKMSTSLMRWPPSPRRR